MRCLPSFPAENSRGLSKIAKSTKTRTIFPPRPCKSTTDKLSTFKKRKFNKQSKVISTRLNDHFSVTEPVEVTGNAFCATNSFPTLKKYKFSEQENIICEFCFAKLDSKSLICDARTQGLRHKMPSETSDGFTASDKLLSEVSDAFTATDKTLSETSDVLPAIDKRLSEASDGFTALDKRLSEASDGFTATDRALSETSDALPATDKMQSEVSDGFTANDKAPSEPSDGFTATESRMFDTLNFVTGTRKGLELVKNKDMLKSKFSRVSRLNILSQENKEFL